MEIINKIDELDSLLFTMLYISHLSNKIYMTVLVRHHKSTIYKDIYQTVYFIVVSEEELILTGGGSTVRGV